MSKSWATTKGGDNERMKRWEDSVEKLELTKDYQTVRFLEAPSSGAKHWIEFKNEEGQKKGFYSPCFAFNSETDSFENTSHCPACKAGIKAGLFYASNSIVRALQEDKPENAKKEKPNDDGFKSKDDKGWSPVRVVVVPSSMAKKIRNIVTLNKYKIDGKQVSKSVEDKKFGCDLEISFDKDAGGGGAMYDIQKGDKSSLTEEELKYLRYDLSIIPNFMNSKDEDSLYYKDKKDIERSLKRLNFLEEEGSEDSDVPTKRRKDDEDDEEVPVKKRSKDDEDDEIPVKKSKKVDDEESEEPNDDEEPIPPKKSKKSDDEDDEEEDEKPVKKKVKKIEVDEDEDEEESDDDEEEEDDDDDDEEVKPKKKSKKVDDDDDEEETEKPKKKVNDDDDDDDAPKKKSKKASSSDDDDDDWET